MKKAEDVTYQAKMYERVVLGQVGSFVNRKRKEKDITIRQLNAMTGVSIAVISDLENARCMPRVETLLRIGEALDIPNTILFDQMKLVSTAVGKGSRIKPDNISEADKYDQLGTFIVGLDLGYSKEDVIDLITYAKFLKYKKQS